MNEIPKPASPLPWTYEDRAHWHTPSSPMVQDTLPRRGDLLDKYNHNIAEVREGGGRTWGTVGHFQSECANAAYIVWAANNATRLYEALEMIVNLCKHASRGAFSNGVTDNTGTIDEGDVRAGELIHQADEALRAAREAKQ